MYTMFKKKRAPSLFLLSLC